MADDEVRSPPEPPRSGTATPNRGRRREPPTIEGMAEDVTATPASKTAAAENATVHEPSMAAAGADTPSMPGSDPAGEAPNPAGSAMAGPDSPGRLDSDAPTPAAAASSRSVLPTLLSTLALLLTLGLGWYVYQQQQPSGDTDLSSDVTALKQRLATLENRPAGPAIDLGPLQDRIAALEAATGQLKTDLADTRAKLDDAAKIAPAPQPETPAPLAAVPPGPDLGPLDAKVADLGQTLTALQGQVAALPKVDVAPLDAKVADLGQTVMALQGEVAALPKVDLAPLDARIAGLDQRLAPLEQQLAVPKSTTQITEARQEGSAAESRAAPLAVAAQATLQALSQGRPLTPEVAALRSLGVDAATLAPLEALADKGAPTRADLLAGFVQIRESMAGAPPPKPTGTALDRILANAEGLVKTRPAGAKSGDDPDAVVSRIDADLQHGGFQAALAEWDKLPDDGKTASQRWADRLKSRVDADQAARKVLSDAIGALGAAK